MNPTLGLCPYCYKVIKEDEQYEKGLEGNEIYYYHPYCAGKRHREEFVKEKKPQWEAIGRVYKEKRESEHFSIAEMAEYLGVSETKMRKFESGKPITHSKLLAMAYEMYFNLYSTEVILKKMEQEKSPS